MCSFLEVVFKMKKKIKKKDTAKKWAELNIESYTGIKGDNFTNKFNTNIGNKIFMFPLLKDTYM